MARLRLAQGLSLVSPPDGVDDAVSTPIRFILFAHEPASEPQCEDFTRVERSLLNSIWHPATGPHYFPFLLALVLFPFILFVLKSPSTLGSVSSTWLLFGLGGDSAAQRRGRAVPRGRIRALLLGGAILTRAPVTA